MSYNGHKNWTHWNVSLWVGNDEGIYNLAVDLCRECKTKDRAARRLKAMLPERTPDGARYSFTAIRAALVEL